MSGLLADVLSSPAVCRVAPSPTGFFHVGTARVALHNWLAARASGGRFILRIDDTDRARNDQAHVDLILRCMDFLGLDYDDTFTQSSRLDRHMAAAAALVGAGLAVKSDGATVLSRDAVLPSEIVDMVAGRMPVSQTAAKHVEDLVLLRSDGFPTYHFASVVDDIDSGVGLVIRGADHLSNLAKHRTIGDALHKAGYPGADSFQGCVFAHVGLLTKGGRKVSKRDGGSSFEDLMAGGSPPAAIRHWLMQFGWGHPDPEFDKKNRMIGVSDMPSVFAQGKLRGANCELDMRRLEALSKRYSHAARAMVPG